jgi:hypothetical protein
MKMRLVEILLRLGLGGLFLYAGAAKILDLPAAWTALRSGRLFSSWSQLSNFETFFWDIHHYELTPWNVSMVAAMFLPWLEVFAAVALIVRRLYLGAIASCSTMSAVFLSAILNAWVRGLDITCGCFGKNLTENATNFPQHIALNAAMLGAALLLWWLAARARRESVRAL